LQKLIDRIIKLEETRTHVVDTSSGQQRRWPDNLVDELRAHQMSFEQYENLISSLKAKNLADENMKRFIAYYQKQAKAQE